MYTIVDNPKRMTKDEIRAEFANKWVFVVECDFILSLSFLTNELNVFGFNEVVENE